MNKEAKLGIGLAVALAVACAGPQRAEAPASSNEGFITPKPVVVTPEPIKPIEYLNDEGARVVSEGNRMTVSKDDLTVIVICVPAHDYNGRMLEAPHIDLSTEATGLNDYRNYWLTVATPVLEGNVETVHIVSTGLGNQAVRVNLHDNAHTSLRGAKGKPIRFLPGRPVTVSIFDEPYIDGEPKFGFPVKQVTVLTPSPCPNN